MRNVICTFKKNDKTYICVDGVRKITVDNSTVLCEKIVERIVFLLETTENIFFINAVPYVVISGNEYREEDSIDEHIFRLLCAKAEVKTSKIDQVVKNHSDTMKTIGVDDFMEHYFYPQYNAHGFRHFFACYYVARQGISFKDSFYWNKKFIHFVNKLLSASCGDYDTPLSLCDDLTQEVRFGINRKKLKKIFTIFKNDYNFLLSMTFNNISKIVYDRDSLSILLCNKSKCRDVVVSYVNFCISQNDEKLNKNLPMYKNYVINMLRSYQASPENYEKVMQYIDSIRLFCPEKCYTVLVYCYNYPEYKDMPFEWALSLCE